MIQPSRKELGTLQALLHRFITQRLPRLLRIKAAMEEGGKLATTDVAFLYEVLESASQIKPLMDRHPDFQPLYARSVLLFHQITSLALENERY